MRAVQREANAGVEQSEAGGLFVWLGRLSINVREWKASGARATCSPAAVSDDAVLSGSLEVRLPLSLQRLLDRILSCFPGPGGEWSEARSTASRHEPQETRQRLVSSGRAELERINGPDVRLCAARTVVEASCEFTGSLSSTGPIWRTYCGSLIT